MSRLFKQKLMPIMFLLAILTVASIYTAFLPTANAAEPSLQTKSLTVLSDVIGINMDLYNTSKSTQSDNEFLNSPQKEADIQLTSAQGNLRVTCYYVKDTLKLVYLSDVEGNVSLKQPVNNTIDMARGMLERYGDYCGDSVYDTFASMLNDSKADENSIKLEGNLKLEVSASDQNRVSYMWTYVDPNGVPAEKKNVILVYEKGTFKGFFNNWPLYTIGETQPKFSAEQAEKLAIEASKNFSYPVIFDNGTEMMVSGFSIAPESLGNAKLIYINSVEQEFARDGDPYRMYLAWYVPLGFDKFYPGDVSGMTVILWADTGEVCSMDRVIVDSGLADSLAPQAIEDAAIVAQASQYQPTDLSTQAIGVSAAAGLVFVSLGTSKLMSPRSKKRNCKLLGTLLCVSVAFSMISLSLPSVSATGKSRVYGINVGDDLGYKNEAVDRAEGDASRDLCNFIGNATVYAGYDTTNSFGSGTINTTVISNAGSDEQSFAGTMVFHAGHFTQFNQAYKDNLGGRIDANDIKAQTGLGKHFFVFIWVCVQAENPTSGMPAAWLHRDGSIGHPLLGSDGFTNPDPLGQCYISFYGFSPMLSTCSVPYASGYYYNFAGVGSSGPCSTFAKLFYNFTLYQDKSVQAALDLASGEWFGVDYSHSVLHTGYSSWWPGGENWASDPDMPFLVRAGYFPVDFRNETGLENRPDNCMRVFGDSSIHLTAPPSMVNVALACRDNNDNPLNSDVYIDGYFVGSYTDQTLRIRAGVHSVSVPDKDNYTFWRFSYNGGYYYDRPANITMTANGALTIRYNQVVYCDLTVSAGSGGTTDPSPGIHTYIAPSDRPVRAVPDSGKVLDYWLLDGQPAGNRYLIYIEMTSSDRTLNATFTDRPSYSFSTDLYDYSAMFSPSLIENPYDLTGYQPDGYYATINSYAPYTTYGFIDATLNEQTTGHIFLYAHSGYESSALSVSVSNNGQSWTSLGVTEFTSTPGWVYCGASLTSFSYVKLEGAGSTCDTVYIDSIRVEPPTYHTLTISSTTGGYTIPSEDPEYLYGTTANVQAYTDSGYQFDYWLLDESYAGSSSYIEVPMYSDHTLEAVFSEIPPPEEYYLTILGRREEELMPFSVWIDDEDISYMDTGTYVYSGEHKIEVEQEYAYYVFSYFDVDGAYVDYYNPTWIDVQSDMTITANYDYSYWFLEMMVLVNEKGMTVQQAFDVVQVKFDLTSSHFEALKDVNWASQYQILQNNHKLDVVTVDSGLK